MRKIIEFLPDHLKQNPHTMHKDMGNIEALTDQLRQQYIHYEITAHGPISTISTRHAHATTYSVVPAMFLAQHLCNAENFETVLNADSPSVEDIAEVVWVHERPLRFWVMRNLLETQDVFPDAALADLIIDVYTDTEIFDKYFSGVWAKFLSEHRVCLRAHTLPIACPEGVGAMDTKIYIYHGVEFDEFFEHPASYQARAWTTSEKVARFFAARLCSKNIQTRPVLRKQVSYDWINKQATFYTDSRNEKEIYFCDGLSVKY